jgi:xanthine dehydrogenase small subunit
MREKASRQWFEPRSLRDALRLLRDEQGLVPAAGCTDIYVSLNAGVFVGSRFLNIGHLDELRAIREQAGSVRIGALATFSDLQRSPIVASRIPMLAEASGEIGSRQVQNRGTIGGNIGNASPAGDTLPVLAAADAIVLLRSVDGERRIPFSRYFTGYRRTVRREDELIVGVEIPAIDGVQWFRKVGTRGAQAISKVVLACVRGARPRVALGSVAPTVVRAPKTEQVLAATGSIADARAVLASEIAPIDDLRSTAAYRRQVACNLLARFWRETRGPA